MNGIRVLLGALLVLPVMAEPSFSGKWEFNPSQSKNVGMMTQLKLTATVRQTSDEMIITNTSTFNGQDQTSETKFDLTGKPAPNKDPMGVPADTVTKWDGNRLVTTWTSPGSVAGTKSVRTETRYLADGGRLMTVESKRGQAPPMVMVYERK